MKLFHKIAVTTLGLAMATAVGVGIAHHNHSDMRAAEAATISLLSFARDGSTDNYTSGATFTKAADGKTGYYQDGSNNPAYLQLKVDSALSIPSDAKALTLTAKIGGGSTKDISDTPVKCSLLDSTGVKIAGSEQDLATNITAQTGSDFEVDYLSFKSTSIYGVRIEHAKIASYNARYYSFALTYETASSNPNIELSKASLNLGVGTTDSVNVTFQDLTTDITVAKTAGDGAVEFESSISKDESSPFTYSIKGKTAGDVTLSFSSTGATAQTLNIHIVDTEEYKLVESLSYITPGSEFIIVGDDGAGVQAVLSTTLSSGIYAGGLIDINAGKARTIYGNLFTLEIVGGKGLIKDSNDKYLGASALDGTGKLVLNADYTQIAYPYWSCAIDETTHVATINIDTDAAGNNKLLNFNPGYNRFTNYNVSQTPCTYIYSASLAPTVYADPDNVEIDVGKSATVDLSAVNFGEEAVTYTATSASTAIATVSESAGVLTINGVAAGSTTVTVEGNSAHYGPASTEIHVKVNSASRVLSSISLSVSEETLFKGQEFSYSGEIHANYSDSTSELVAHDQATFTGYDMSTISAQEVTVSFTKNEVTKTATYTLNVVQWKGALDVGDYYVMTASYTKDAVTTNYALTNVGLSGKKSIGFASVYTDTLRSECALLVEAGNTYNSYSFKLANGKYLSSINDNVLNTSETKDDNSSWTVSDLYDVANVATSRVIRFNGSDPRFVAYASGQQPVSFTKVTYAEMVSDFAVNFMHPEISFDNNEDTGMCRDVEDNPGYYTLASTAFNTMQKEARDFFMESSIYTNYKLRLLAWAAANNQIVDANNMLVANESNVTLGIVDNNVMIIVVVTTAVAIASLMGVYFIIRKRKEQR